MPAAISYSEKLKDPRWQKKRLEILDRDNWTCLECGDKASTLHVHHLFYVFNAAPWVTPSFGLQTLCENCHKTASHVAAKDKGMDQFFWSAIVFMDCMRKFGMNSSDVLDFSFQLSQLTHQDFYEFRDNLPSTPGDDTENKDMSCTEQ